MINHTTPALVALLAAAVVIGTSHLQHLHTIAGKQLQNDTITNIAITTTSITKQSMDGAIVASVHFLSILPPLHFHHCFFLFFK
jgi:hypothetical protein